MRLFVVAKMPSPAFDKLDTQVYAIVEMRLKEAKLISTQQVPIPAQYVENDGWDGHAFDMKLAFRKWVYDPIANTTRPGSTWLSSAVGMADGSSPRAVFNAVHSLMDHLLEHYRRVNQGACVDR